MENKLKKGDCVRYVGPVQSLYGKKKYKVIEVSKTNEGIQLAEVKDMKTFRLGPTNRADNYKKIKCRKRIGIKKTSPKQMTQRKKFKKATQKCKGKNYRSCMKRELKK